MAALASVSNWRAQEPTVGVGQLNGLLIHAVPLQGARGQNDFGAQHAHELTAFDGKAVRHGDDQRIAFLCADHGKPDAGITAGCLDHSLTRLERSTTLTLFDNV